MRIPKKIQGENEGFSEEKYEESQIESSDSFINVIYLVFIDNELFYFPINSRTDSLDFVKSQLHEILSEKSHFYPDHSVSDLKFLYFSQNALHEFSSENERIPIFDLISSSPSEYDVNSSVLKVYVMPKNHTLNQLPTFTNEMFRETVKVEYISLQKELEKVVVGRTIPKPEVLLISLSGYVEDHLKLKNLEHISEGSSILFKSNLESSKNKTKNIEFRFHFSSESSKTKFENTLQAILQTIEAQKTPQSLQMTIKKFNVKKQNRYGINQKRHIWIDHESGRFHISTDKGKNEKKFLLTEIKNYSKTTRDSRIIIEFYDSKAKKLKLIFAKNSEMDEFIKFAESITNKIFETTRNSGKFSAPVPEIYADNLRYRRFSWFDEKSPLGNNQNSINEKENNYTVIQKGLISYEKIILNIDVSGKKIRILNHSKEIIKIIDAISVTIKHDFKNLCKIRIFCADKTLDFIFSSATSKYLFLNNFYHIKNEEKVYAREDPHTAELLVYTNTWNLGSFVDPSPEVLDVLLMNSQNHGLICLGFQQCPNAKINNWLLALNSFFLTRKIRLISFEFFFDMFSVVLIHESLKNHVNQVKSCVRSGKHPNKGAIIVSITLQNTNFCFINSHLSVSENLSHKTSEIIELLQTPAKFTNFDLMVDHDYIFFLGDLNFPIAESKENINNAIKLEAFSELSNSDRLAQIRGQNLLLSVFNEGTLNFLPTYPVKSGPENNFGLAWNDRILFKSNKSGIEILSYGSIDDYLKSNHKPIFAAFKVELRFWHVPRALTSIEFGFLKLQHFRISTESNTNTDSISLNFYSQFFSEYIPTKIGNKIDSRTFEFKFEKNERLKFINLPISSYKDQRVLVNIKENFEDGKSEVLGFCNLQMNDVIEEFSRFSNEVSGNSLQKLKKITAIEVPIEKNTRFVGKLIGLWRYAIKPSLGTN